MSTLFFGSHISIILGNWSISMYIHRCLCVCVIHLGIVSQEGIGRLVLDRGCDGTPISSYPHLVSENTKMTMKNTHHPPLNWLVDRYPGYPFCGLSWSQINSKGQFPHYNQSTSMNNAIVHGWNNHYQFDHVWSLFCGRAMTTPDLSGYVDGGVNLQPAKKCLQQSLCKSKRLGTMGR